MQTDCTVSQYYRCDSALALPPDPLPELNTGKVCFAPKIGPLDMSAAPPKGNNVGRPFACAARVMLIACDGTDLGMLVSDSGRPRIDPIFCMVADITVSMLVPAGSEDTKFVDMSG